eukprot:TRINITY_DN22264_c0_g1_i1.p1 TRINITY_DN22264_c0_g1~~TRINITY_DN22264_c0_g1_i1.p1  ORF type:complete len:2435 (+),score=486.95 TRINITY_DN22264_c0_g1_i1:82-7386(+)
MFTQYLLLILFLLICTQRCDSIGKFYPKLTHPDDYTYVGCYTADAYEVDLDAPLSSQSPSIEFCYALCFHAKTLYFGIADGSKCYCTNTFGKKWSRSNRDCSSSCASGTGGCGGPTQKVRSYVNGWPGGTNFIFSIYAINYYRPSFSYFYVGCLKDNSTALDLPFLASSSSAMTIEICYSLCKNHNFFGLQNGRDCYCGYSYGRYGMAGGGSIHCNMPCSGGTGDMCGSKGVNSVYALKRYSVYTEKIGKYQGCYSNRERLFDNTYTVSASQTNDNCFVHCNAIGSAYLGTKGGNQCYCGVKTSLPSPDSSNCNISCVGDPSQYCGGDNTFTVNSISSVSEPYILRGCFRSDMNMQFTTVRSVSECFTACRNGSNYFGIFNGDQCFCTQTFMTPIYGTYNALCNVPCNGDNKTHYCGGRQSYVYYEIKILTDVSLIHLPPPTKCVYDLSKYLSTLPSGAVDDSSLSVDVLSSDGTKRLYSSSSNLPTTWNLVPGDTIQCSITPCHKIGTARTCSYTILGDSQFISGIVNIYKSFPPGLSWTYTLDDESTLVLYSDIGSFNDAIGRCSIISTYSRLAMVTTRKFNDIVSSLLLKSGINSAFISLKFDPAVKKYVWLDGSEFLPWSGLQIPTNSTASNACVVVNSDASWTFTSCSSYYPSICAFPHLAGERTITGLLAGSSGKVSYDTANGICSSYGGTLSRIFPTLDATRLTTHNFLSHFTNKALWINTFNEIYSDIWYSKTSNQTKPVFDIWKKRSLYYTEVPTCCMARVRQGIDAEVECGPFCDMLENGYYCDVPLLVIKPRHDRIFLSKTMIPSSVANSLILKVSTSTDYSVITETNTYNGYPNIPSEIPNLVPGVSYHFSLSSSSGTSDWVRVKTYCDCNYDSINNGAPANFVVLQNNGRNYFEWDDVSACDSSFVIFRGNKQIFDIPSHDPLSCLAPDEAHKSFPNVYDDVSQSTVGTEFEYCLQARRPAGSSTLYPSSLAYSSPFVCSTKQLQWEVKINGVVASRSDDPISDTTIKYWINSTPIQGEAQTDANGIFSFTILTSTLRQEPQTLNIQAIKVTGGVTHVFEWKSCFDATKNYDSATTDKACFTNRTYGTVTVEHLQNTALKIVDLTAFSVQGMVVFNPIIPSALPIGSNCMAVDSVICLRIVKNQEEKCVTTKDGHFDFSFAPMWTNVELHVNFTSGNKSHFISSPCNGGRIVSSTPTNPVCNFYLDSDKNNIVFTVTSSNTIELQTFGGYLDDCAVKLGELSYSLSAVDQTLCPWNYLHRVTDIVTKIDIPPISVQISHPTILPKGNGFLSSSQVPVAQEYLNSLYSSPLLAQMHFNSYQILTWQFNVVPQLSFISVGDNLLSTTCNRFIVAGEGNPDIKNITVLVQATEIYNIGPDNTVKNCKALGKITYFDGLVNPVSGPTEYAVCKIGGPGCSLDLIPVVGHSFASFKTLPGTPIIIPPYTKPLKITFSAPLRSSQAVAEVLVTGVYSNGKIYSDEWPKYSLEVPTLLLRDPPGDMSYAFITEGTEISTTFSINFQTNNPDGSFNKNFGSGSQFVWGAGFSASTNLCIGLGSEVCLTSGSGQATFGTSEEDESSLGTKNTYALNHKFSLTSTIKTSEDAQLTDGWGDVVIYSAISVQKLEVYKIEISPNCQVSKTLMNVWGMQSEGYAVKTMYDIVFIDIPNIVKDINATSLNNTKNAPQQKDLQNLLNLVKYHQSTSNNVPLTSQLQKKCSLSDIPDTGYSLDKALDTEDMDMGNVSQVDGKIDFKKKHVASLDASSSCQSNWEDVLVFDTIFFTGGGQTYSFSFSIEDSEGGDFGHYASESHKDGDKYDISAFIYLGFTINSLSTTSYSSSLDKTFGLYLHSTTSAGFVLGDRQIGDKYNVKILMDKNFGLPVFSLLNGISSCPHTSNTISRDLVSATVDPAATLTNLPYQQRNTFEIAIDNLSETQEERFVTIQLDPVTNPDGLGIHINGISLTEKDISKLLPFGRSIFTVELTRGPIAFNYTDVNILVSATCDYLLQTPFTVPTRTVLSLDVNYLQPCARMEWVGDWSVPRAEYFVINSKSGPNDLVVTVRNPDYPLTYWAENPNFVKAVVQYKLSTGNAPWLDVAQLSENEGNGYATTTISTTGWKDGNYLLRVISTCIPQSSVYDPQVKSFVLESRQGLVDRQPPVLFGLFPEPSDGIFTPGDEISLTFTEPIDCTLPYPFSTYALIDTSRIDISSNTLSMICKEGKIVFAFSFSGSLSYSSIAGKTVQFLAGPFYDIAGNTDNKTYRWSFMVENTQTFAVATALGSMTKKRDLSAKEGVLEDVLCAEIAKLIEVPSERCRIFVVSGDGEWMNIKFTFSPGYPSTLVLLEKLQKVLDDPLNAHLREDIAGFSYHVGPSSLGEQKGGDLVGEAQKNDETLTLLKVILLSNILIIVGLVASLGYFIKKSFNLNQ